MTDHALRTRMATLGDSARNWPRRIVGDGWRDWRRPGFWLLLIVVAGVAFRLFYVLWPFERFVAGFLADDFFYYAKTALAIADGHGSSFDDGLTRHNGYHPLFMALLVIAAALGCGKIPLIYVAMAILITAHAAATVLAYKIGARLGNPWLALCMPISLSLNTFFVLSTLHGFETSLAVALLLALVLAVLDRRPAWELGLWLGLAGLARVDTLVLGVPLALALVLDRRWRSVPVVAAVSLALMSPWLIWSQANFGSFMPLSGVAKLNAFAPSHLWPGLKIYTRNLVSLLFGLDLKLRLPLPVMYAAGVAILTVLVRGNWRRNGWLVAYAALVFTLYSTLTNHRDEFQLVRYGTPAIVVLGILFFARWRPRRAFLAPILVLISVVWTTEIYVSWSLRQPLPSTFVGYGQRAVPAILEEIADDDDLVGCFDSGAIGYFAGRPVVNLDGLANAEIVFMLRGDEGGAWDRRYRRYFRDKGITIMVGGTGFSWIRMFKDVDQWQELAPPLELYGGKHQIVFLRVPDYGPDGSPD